MLKAVPTDFAGIERSFSDVDGVAEVKTRSEMAGWVVWLGVLLTNGKAQAWQAGAGDALIGTAHVRDQAKRQAYLEKVFTPLESKIASAREWIEANR
jgi:hypothetical protein